MSLLRRNKKNEEEEIETADDMLDDGEAGSMFMSASGTPEAAAPESEESDVEGDEADPAAAEAVDGLVPDEELPEGEPAAEGEGDAADKTQVEVQTVSGGGEDDALALFGEVAGHSGLGDLAEDLEEMSIEELMADLREVRGMLPAVSVDADDPTED